MHTRTPIPAAPSEETATWTDLLRKLAASRPQALAYTFLPPGGATGTGDGAGQAPPVTLTFGELDERARAIAARLQRHAEPGARALLLFSPGLDYVSAFFGCLYSGIVAVPAYPPDRSRLARTLPRIKAIASDAEASLILTSTAVAKSGGLDAARTELGGIAQVTTDDVVAADAARWRAPDLTPESVALLQYTSGSTSTPSGVILTHRNMLANAAIQRRAWSLTPASIGVSWLPLYHDLGVISCLLQPVFVGFHTVLLSPADFIQQPLRWLEAISRFGGTFAGGPNFAFDLCVRGTTPEQRAKLDLRAWETAFNGAEPIRPESLDRFADAFASAGFRRSAVYPCYGLAEANFVTGMRPGAGAKVEHFDASGLEQGEAGVAAAGTEKRRALVSCGEIPPEQILAIVDPEAKTVCPPGRVGEVWLSGASVGRGYWGRPDASEATFGATCRAFGDARFLRTGDLGFVEAGQLYLTGRLKDLIIIRGANHYPQDIERTVERAHPAMRAGCGAAFAVEQDGDERVVVVLEIQNVPGVDLAAVLEAARAAVLREHEIALGAVVLLRAGAIPKTTSGKIQRRACRTAFLEGALEAAGEWRQTGQTVRPPSAPAPSPARPSAAPAAAARSAAEVEAWLVASLSRLLKTDPRHIDTREPFSSYGLDSLRATELSGALEAWLGRRVEPTAVYEHATVEALAKHLATGAAPASWAPPKAGRPERAPANEPIAIIGIGCRFPGSDSPRAFWSALRDGIDSVTEVPTSRWDNARVYDVDGTKAGKTSSRWGGFLREVDRFDSLFFGISPREARHMDPQQRLLLEVAWEALEDAGQVPAELRGSATGVFLGMTTDDYGRMQWTRPAAIDMYSATGTLSSVAAGRLSYAFDFRGPSLALDTACSSSLVAIHYACQSIWSGEATLALAGGVNLMLTPENGISQTKLGALSADGKCKAFDDRADGFVRGEGAGLVVLKRLSAAIADGDRIYAVIRGSAVNQDGRSNGLTAPNPQAQRAVLRAAYKHASVSPGEVQYVEAHGTGTRLGDPIELRALGRVLATERAEGETCAVGSVKTNIGHLESAAGVAGIIKTALALHHEALPGNLHFERANPLIPFDKLPVRVQDRLTGWPRGTKPRFAGVSAFGIGGTNAHVVLEEAPTREGAHASEPAVYVLPISARSRAALVALASSYAESLSRGALRTESLGDVCYTASVRREHFEHRVCVVGRNRAAVVARLEAFVRGESAPTAASASDELAARYQRGEEVDFRSLHGVRRALVTLPSYTWQRARHWLESAPAPVVATISNEGGARHPLLDRHVETAAGELLWEIDVSPESHGFVQDHVLGGARVFAGLAYVEMALAAGHLALGDEPLAATEIEFLSAMFVPDGETQTLQITLTLDGAGGGAFRIHSRPAKVKRAKAAPWKLHARGKLVADTDVRSADLDPAIRARCDEAVAGDAFYDRLRATGTSYGPRFRGIETIARRDGEALAAVSIPASLAPELGADAEHSYLFHPALLDACAQTLLATQSADHPFMPVRIERLRLLGRAGAGGALESHALVTKTGEAGALHGDIRVYRVSKLVAEITAARLQLLDRMQRASAAPEASTYEIVWNKKRPSTVPPPARTRSTWILFSDRHGVGDALAARLTEQGDRCVSLQWQAHASADSIRAVVTDVAASAGAQPLRAVVYLGSLGASAPPAKRNKASAARTDGKSSTARDARAPVESGSLASLAPLARHLMTVPGAPRLWAVTRGSQSLGNAGGVQAAQAPLWGFARSIAAECPRVWGGLIDLDRAEVSADEHAAAIERAIEGKEVTNGEDQIAVRGGEEYVPRLARRSDLAPKASVPLRADGAYVVTGGLGGLGLKVAGWMVDRGARHILLLSRTPLPPRALWSDAKGEIGERIAAIRALEALGANVTVAAVDVANEATLKAALDAFTGATRTPIRGVVHAAGVGHLRPLSEVTEATLEEDLRPKVAGAANLDRLLESAPLDFFILYSSLSAVLPSPLMAGYAASNAFLEALARNRHARGKPALCIHWGMWADVGMAARAQAQSKRGGDWKVGSLSPDEAIALQQRLLDEGAVVAIATRTDWAALARENAGVAASPLLSLLVEAPAHVAPARSPGLQAPGASHATVLPPALPVAAKAGALSRAALAALALDERVARLTAYLKSTIEDVLALGDGALPEAEPLDTVGYDSLAAVDVQIRINKELDIDVPLLALLQRGSARELAARVAQLLGSTTAAPAPVVGSERAAAPPPEALQTKARVAPLPPLAACAVGPGVTVNDVAATFSLYAARTPTLPPATHTNSYALGGRDVLLVEPATPFESEQRAWIEWARGLAAQGRRPVAIFATHHHDDHIGGLDVLSRELDLPVWMHRETWLRVGAAQNGGKLPARFLDDGETIRLDGPTPEAWQVLHTPGHAPGHVCLWNAANRTIVAGDMVASVGTILIAPGDGDLQPYLVQLERLARLGADWALPAHGAPIASPTALFRRYVEERERRERDVLGALTQVGALGGTAENLVSLAYSDAPPHTWPIGLLSLRAHLEKLLREGRVVENDGVFRHCG